MKEFFKTKKGKTVIITVIGGAILHFFPESAGFVAEFADIMSEILSGIADKVEPTAVTPIT